MPFKIERDGKEIEVFTREEVDSEVRGLKITNENLKAEKQELADKNRDAKESLRELEEAKAKAEGDNETLKRLADEREAEKQRAIDEERKKTADLINTVKKEKTANFIDSILDDVKPVDAIKRKQLKKLLKVDYEFDVDLETQEFTVRGDNVLSVDDLKRVISESEEYQGFIQGSGANGGGATGGNASGAGKKAEDYTEAERVALYRTNPAKFNELFKR